MSIFGRSSTLENTEMTWIGARREGNVPTIVLTHIVQARGRGVSARRREAQEMPRNWILVPLGLRTGTTPDEWERSGAECA